MIIILLLLIDVSSNMKLLGVPDNLCFNLSTFSLILFCFLDFPLSSKPKSDDFVSEIELGTFPFCFSMFWELSYIYLF